MLYYTQGKLYCRDCLSVPLITIKLGGILESFYVLLHVQALFGTYFLNLSIVCNQT